jgi:hypothetical protein
MKYAHEHISPASAGEELGADPHSGPLPYLIMGAREREEEAPSVSEALTPPPSVMGEDLCTLRVFYNANLQRRTVLDAPPSPMGELSPKVTEGVWFIPTKPPPPRPCDHGLGTFTTHAVEVLDTTGWKTAPRGERCAEG